MKRRAWLLIAIAAGIPAAAAQERPPAWMAACPPFCDPAGLFGNAPKPVPVEKKKPHPAPPGVENDTAGDSADVPIGAVPGRESEARSTMSPAPAWVDEMDLEEAEPSAREATVEEKDNSQGASSPRASVEEKDRARSPLPAGRIRSGKDVTDEPVLERPTPALKTAREQASPVPAKSDPPRSYAPAELERPTEAFKVPLPPRKPVSVPEPKRRSPEKQEIAAAPVAAPLAKKAAPKAGKKGRDSLIKPVEPIFDPRYPADAMVKTPFGMTDMTRDGFEIKAFDSRNRVLLQKGSAIALCRFDSVELPVTGGSYVGNSECYVTQRPVRP